MRASVGFDDRSLYEMRLLWGNISSFYFLEATGGVADIPSRAMLWARGGETAAETLLNRLRSIFSSRLSKNPWPGSYRIDNRLDVALRRNGDIFWLEIEVARQDKWREEDFRLLHEVDRALQGLPLEFISKPPGTRRTFFRGEVVE